MLPFFIFTLPLLQMGSSLQEEILFVRLSVITFLLQDIVSLFSFPVLLLLLWPNIFPLPISSSFYFFAGQVFSYFSFSVFFLPISILSYWEYSSSTPPLTIYFHPFPSPWRGVEFDQVFFSLFSLLIEISSTHLTKMAKYLENIETILFFWMMKYFFILPSKPSNWPHLGKMKTFWRL